MTGGAAGYVSVPPRRPRGRRRYRPRRVGTGGLLGSWAHLARGLADQAVSSGTNFLTSLLTARLLAPAEYGQVVIAMTVGVLALAAGRASVGSVLLAVEPVAERGAGRRLVADALSVSLLIGVGAAVLGLAIGFLPVPAAAAITAVAVWIPGVVVQDALRYAAFRDSAPGRALLLDVVWALAQGCAVVVLLGAGQVGVTTLIGAWGVGALVSALVGLWLARPTLALAGARRWLRRTRAMRGWYAGQEVLSQMHVQVVIWTTGAMLGTSDVGGLRAVQTLVMMPASSALVAMQSLIVPAMARRAANGDLAGLRRSTVRLTWLFGGCAALLGLVACLTRQPFVEGVFTSRFAAYTPLMFPVALTAVGFGLTTPVSAACRALQDGRAVFALQASFTVVVVPACILGAVVGGIGGSAWGMPLAGAAQTAACAWAFRRRLVTPPLAPAARALPARAPAELG